MADDAMEVPLFGQRRTGVVVNVASSVTLKPLPLLSVYTASKAAVDAFSEVLALELQEFDVGVRLVQPGRAPETRFGDNARSHTQAQGGFPEAYRSGAEGVRRGEQEQSAVTRPLDVAEAVWLAATDPLSPARIPACADAVALAG